MTGDPSAPVSRYPRPVRGLFFLMFAVGVAGCGTITPCKYGDREGCVAACEQKHAPSCTRLAAMQEGAGSADASQGALETYVRACLLGSGAGCHMAGLKMTLGVGTKPNLEQAQKSFEAACALNYADGCAMSGALLAAEQPPRRQEAEQRYARACGLGSVLGCQLNREAAAPLFPPAAPPPSAPPTSL